MAMDHLKTNLEVNLKRLRSSSYNNRLECFASKLAGSICTGNDEAKVQSIFGQLEESGILSSDPRLKDLHLQIDGADTITKNELINVINNNIEIFQKSFSHQLVIPNFTQFKQRVELIYDKVKENTNGKVADYIPQIGKADPNQFGVSICMLLNFFLFCHNSDIAPTSHTHINASIHQYRYN